MSVAEPAAGSSPPGARIDAGRLDVGMVIDFEHFAMHANADSFVADRVRLAGLLPEEPGALRTPAQRAPLLCAWIRSRRDPVSTSPGQLFERARATTRWIAVGGGLVVGAALAGSLLSRNEREPINALMFLGGTVGLQVAVLVLVGLAFLARRIGLRARPLQDSMLALTRLAGRAIARLPGERRAALRAHWATIDLRAAALAPLVECDLLMITQAFAIAFNLGLLAAMLLVYLPFVELRFGWQSTYSFGAGGVQALVDAVAWPWHGLSSGLAPDAAQIAATQYTRGQGAETLPAAAGRAWWPFLLCAIAVYGLLLRAMLAGVVAAVRRHLLRPSRVFASPAATRVWRGLQAPLVAADAPPSPLDAAVASGARAAGGDILLLIDDELEPRAAAVVADVALRLRCRVWRHRGLGLDDDRLSPALLEALRDAAAGGADVVVATSAQRDPIVAVAECLRAVVAARPAGSATTVVLLGTAGLDGFGPVGAARAQVWQRFATLHRLALDVEPRG